MRNRGGSLTRWLYYNTRLDWRAMRGGRCLPARVRSSVFAMRTTSASVALWHSCAALALLVAPIHLGGCACEDPDPTSDDAAVARADGGPARDGDLGDDGGDAREDAGPPGPPTESGFQLNVVGMNLPALSYWDLSFVAADVVRESAFRSLDWGDVPSADERGAPGEDFRLIFSSNTIGAGTYRLQFTGRADLSVGGFSGSIDDVTYDAASNRTTADVVLSGDHAGNAWITFSNTRRSPSSSAADGVTDVHLWRPGYPTDGSVIFTHEFIEAMRTARVLRAMDTLSTNTNGTATWSERTRPDHLGGTGTSGQSWEFLVQLANATERDLWINVPARVDDEYLTKLAQLIRYGSDGVEPYTSDVASPVYPPLRSDLRLYVEYGNEVWNFGGGFYDFGWVKEMSDAARADPEHPIHACGSVADEEWGAFQRMIAYRSAEVSRTFRRVWGDEAMMTRVRPILAAQAGNANGYLATGLQWAECEGGLGSATSLWWGGGGAVYFGSTTDATDTDPTTMAAYFEGLPSSDYADRIRTDTVWLRAYGLHQVAYEGGPEPGIGAAAEISDAYNADPRMPERMGVAYDLWKANGGEVLVYYNYAGMGAPWRFVDASRSPTVSDTTSPKMRFLASLPDRPIAAPTLGTAVPSVVHLRAEGSDVRTRIGGDTSWGYDGAAYRIQAIEGDPIGEMILLPVRASAAGRHSLSIQTFDAASSARVELWANGELVGDLVPGESSPSGEPAGSSALEVELLEGISVLRLRAKTGSVWIRDVVVE